MNQRIVSVVFSAAILTFLDLNDPQVRFFIRINF